MFCIDTGTGVQRLLVISNHVPAPEVLHDAVNQTTQTVALDYKTDSLETLLNKISEAAGSSAGRLSSIGFIDHGEPNEFCLLEDIRVTLKDLQKNKDLRVCTNTFCIAPGPHDCTGVLCGGFSAPFAQTRWRSSPHIQYM